MCPVAAPDQRSCRMPVRFSRRGPLSVDAFDPAGHHNGYRAVLPPEKIMKLPSASSHTAMAA